MDLITIICAGGLLAWLGFDVWWKLRGHSRPKPLTPPCSRCHHWNGVACKNPGDQWKDFSCFESTLSHTVKRLGEQKTRPTMASRHAWEPELPAHALQPLSEPPGIVRSGSFIADLHRQAEERRSEAALAALEAATRQTQQAEAPRAYAAYGPNLEPDPLPASFERYEAPAEAPAETCSSSSESSTCTSSTTD